MRVEHSCQVLGSDPSSFIDHAVLVVCCVAKYLGDLAAALLLAHTTPIVCYLLCHCRGLTEGLTGEQSFNPVRYGSTTDYPYLLLVVVQAAGLQTNRRDFADSVFAEMAHPVWRSAN